MKLKEMLQVVDMLYEEWDLGKSASRAKGKICAWIYLMEILEETERFEVYKDKNKVIGICGYTNYKSIKHKFKKSVYCFFKKLLLLSPTIKNKEELYRYYKNYSYTPLELKDYFDGEISILIVNKDYRNKGIGEKLLLKTFEAAKEDKMKNLQILSDESCNFKFYECLGCKMVYETIVSNGEPNKCDGDKEKAYIYEKVL